MVLGKGGGEMLDLKAGLWTVLQKSNAKIVNNKPIQIKIEIDKNILHEI